MAALPFWFLASLIGVFGAIWGSFAGALCARWPTGESISTGRSRCDHCSETLAFPDLVPLLSFVMLQGKCRHCAARIDNDIFAIELVAVAAGMLPFFLLPPDQALAAALFAWILLPLVVLDIRHLWLPDRLVLGLALGGVLAGPFLIPEIGWIDRLIGGVGGFAALETIRRLYRAVRQREGMGAGDPKLLGAIGIWLGWQALPLVILFASLIGLAWALTAKLLYRRDIKAVAFGAMLGASSLFYAWSSAFRV